MLMTGRAISSLTSNGVEINKEMWMKEAVDAEKGGSILTCQSLIRWHSLRFGNSIY